MDHLNHNPLEPDQFPLPENDQAQDNLYLEDEPTLPLPAEELNFQQDMLLNEEPQLASAIVDWQQEQPADTNQVPDNHGFTDAYVDQNINVDENAIAFHGMTHPDEPEVDYRSYLYADEPAEESGSEDVDYYRTRIWKFDGSEASDKYEKQNVIKDFGLESAKLLANGAMEVHDTIKEGIEKASGGVR